MSNDVETNEPRRKPRPVSRAPDTVYVGCKLPNGLILQNFRTEEYQEQVMGGGTRTARRAVRLEETYKLSGNAIDIAKMALGEVPNLIIAGSAITSGIPRDFWLEWERTNRHSHLIKGGLVWSENTEAGARKHAIEVAKLRTGLEPIDPNAPNAADPSVRRIQRGTTAAA